MTPTRKRRLAAALFILVGAGAATAMLLAALNDNLLFFQSPTDVVNSDIPEGKRFRLGGLVVPGSVKRDPESLAVSFTVTDQKENIDVAFEGILPDLFREGQGIVAIGALTAPGHFQAREVLAKHDENYMSPEVADALERAGHPVNKDAEDNG